MRKHHKQLLALGASVAVSLSGVALADSMQGQNMQKGYAQTNMQQDVNSQKGANNTSQTSDKSGNGQCGVGQDQAKHAGNNSSGNTDKTSGGKCGHGKCGH